MRCVCPGVCARSVCREDVTCHTCESAPFVRRAPAFVAESESKRFSVPRCHADGRPATHHADGVHMGKPGWCWVRAGSASMAGEAHVLARNWGLRRVRFYCTEPPSSGGNCDEHDADQLDGWRGVQPCPKPCSLVAIPDPTGARMLLAPAPTATQKICTAVPDCSSTWSY